MSETPSGFSRRRLLRYGAIGTMGIIAGCLGGDDDSPEDSSPDDGTPDDSPPGDEELPELFELSGNGADPFREWVVPNNRIVHENGTETLFAYRDYERAAESGWEEATNERQEAASSFGSQTDDHTGTVIVGVPDENILGTLYLGSFDKEAVVEAQEAAGATVTGEYEGFTVLEDRLAVGSDALLQTPGYEQHIDARNGDTPRLGESDGSVQLGLDLVPRGLQIVASPNPDHENIDVTITSTQAVDDSGNRQRIIRTFVFRNAEVTSLDRAKSTSNYDELLTEEHHGRVVMLEYVPA